LLEDVFVNRTIKLYENAFLKKLNKSRVTYSKDFVSPSSLGRASLVHGNTENEPGPSGLPPTQPSRHTPNHVNELLFRSDMSPSPTKTKHTRVQNPLLQPQPQQPRGQSRK
jgi:hypothetical protein